MDFKRWNAFNYDFKRVDLMLLNVTDFHSEFDVCMNLVSEKIEEFMSSTFLVMLRIVRRAEESKTNL